MRTLRTAAILAAALCWTAPGTAHAATDFVFKFAHFWPANSRMNTQALESWVEAVEFDSKGRIRIEMYPSQTLTRATQSYDAVINGRADITATVQGYTANRFPLTQVVELPGVSRSADHGSCILQSLYDEGLVSEEYTDTRVLFLFTHGPGHIHTKDKPVRVPGDLQGLTIRRSTEVVANLLDSLGAHPVGMPAPETYQSLQRGVIDGVAISWEGSMVFRLNELAKYHTEFPGGLYTLAFVVTMNKKRYDALPDDLQAVIDKHSGLAWSRRTATIFDDLDTMARGKAVANGHAIHTIEGGIDNPVWKPILAKSRNDYLSGLEAKGLPARRVYDRAMELADECR